MMGHDSQLQPCENLATLQAENEALRRELAEARRQADEARELQRKEEHRKEAIAEVSRVLQAQLFVSTINQEVLKIAECGEDLDQSTQALFALIGKIVRYRWVGIRLSRQGLSAFYQSPADNPEGRALLDAFASGRQAPQPAPEVFTCIFDHQQITLGHCVLVAEGPLSEQDRATLATICHQARPLLERNLLIQLLQQMAGFREEFVTMLAHDLRNPLTGVITALGTALMPGLSLPPEEKDELMRTALTSARAVNALIDDLLEVARLEAGQADLEREPVDLAEQAAIAIEQLRGAATARRLTLALDAPEELPMATGDDRRLLRVFQNLIANALKYTQSGGVLVQLRAVGDRVEAVVADTGLGIPAEAQAHLFEKFYQVPTGKRSRRSGTGLGLAYCREMIEAHGGRIWVASPSRLAHESGLISVPAQREDPGTAFHFSLPVTV